MPAPHDASVAALRPGNAPVAVQLGLIMQFEFPFCSARRKSPAALRGLRLKTPLPDRKSTDYLCPVLLPGTSPGPSASADHPQCPAYPEKGLLQCSCAIVFVVF